MNRGRSMLSKDLLRFSTANGEVRPKLLKPTPAIVTLAEHLLAHWRAGVGQTIGELEDSSSAVLHEARSLQTAKGLQKLLVDECTFREATSCAELREKALVAAALRLASATTMPSDPDQHRGLIAAELGLSAIELRQQLYGDLPHAAVLATVPSLTAEDLLARYNLAQCQGLLLSARELTVTIHDPDIGLRRKLLKALRWQRLLADVRPAGNALCLVISGPGSVLDQASRYGLNLALFLPALACARHWQATAWISPERGGAQQELLLSDETGLRGDTRFLGFIPPEIRALESDITTRKPAWRRSEPQLIGMASGELVVPDLQLESNGVTHAVELFHRWHSVALTRRLAQLAAGEAPGLIIGVDRAVAKQREHAALMESPVFIARGFLFNDLPTIRALAGVIERL